jgi:hypothetical protein
MKQNIALTLTAMAAIAMGTLAHAQDVTYKPTLKQVSMYGAGLKTNEIVASETPEALKFVFSGDAVTDNNQKAIQTYCEVYQLQPGKYNLKFRIKGQAPATQVSANMTAKTKAAEQTGKPVVIGEFKGFPLGGEWKDAVLPLEVKEPLAHGYFIMRVGAVPKGGEISIAPLFTISPAQ